MSADTNDAAPATDSPPAADDGQTPSKQALPPNWVEFVTAINKKPYFYNKVTKETTWVVPEAVEEPPAAEEPPMPPPPAPIIVSREYLADVSLTVTMPERLLATPIAELAVRALENRSSFLVWLKEEFTELANVQDRQKVANAISKVAKTMELPPPPDDPKDKRLANGTLYTKPEFKGYYGGYQEWYLAPRTTLESSPRDRLFKMLEHGRRDDAHAFLYSRGCGSAKERELVMRRTRPPPRDPNAKTEIAEEPPPPTPEADAVIAAGQVAFITLTTAGYASYTANYLESLRRVDECDVPLTVYCADEASFSRLSASWPAGGAAVGGAAAADAAAADAAATDAPHRTPAAGGAAGGAAAGGATSYARIERVPRSEYEFTPPPRMLQPKTDLVWPQLCVLKCRLISAALARCEYVLFTDSDVVALRPGFVRHVIQLLASSSTALADTRGGAASAGGIELLMQNYARHDVETAAKMALDRGELNKERVLKQARLDGGVDVRLGMCAGFLGIRSTAATRAAFAIRSDGRGGAISPDGVAIKAGWSEEAYLNEHTTQRGALKYRALPISLFPNFKYWLTNWEMMHSTTRMRNARPFLVHYDGTTTPEEKRALMKSDKHWYVAELPEPEGVVQHAYDDDDDDDAIV